MVRLRPLLALLLAALALLAPASWAQKPEADLDQQVEQLEATVGDYERYASNPGGERILSYLSEIDVAADGTLNVTETIIVNALGREIRRGIYRDFPTTYIRNNRRVRVGFEVRSVERDGQREPYSLERIDNGKRIRIGDADIFIPEGRHTYVIRYATTRQIGFFQDYDELYWNTTGTDWIFPIDRAEVRIRLPQAVPLSAPSTYTGPQNSTDQSGGEVASQRPGEIVFRTTRPLGPREGITVAARWQKGVIAAPRPPTAARLWFQDYGPAIAAILALIGLAIFYFIAWKRAGRGPVAGTVVPLFEPPDNLSAAAVRYIRRMGYDNRVFAGAIVDSGVRGKLRLVEGEKGWFSGAKTVIHRTAEGDDMPPPERDMLRALFSGGDSIEMDKSNHAIFGAARDALKERLQEAYLGPLFLRNHGWAWVGLVLMLAAMLFVGSVMAFADIYAELGERLLPATGFLLLIGSVLAGINSRFARKDGNWALAGLSALLALGGSAFMVLAFVWALETEGLLVLWMAAPLLALPLVISAFVWMAAPTREGRLVMDRIAGFERYLSITEEDRLEVLHPPEKTPELFERYLPYAIALGVENRWAGKFAGVLAAAAAEPGGHRGMYWYSGSSDPWSNPGMFATAVGGSLASSVAAASTAPGSSSGSGGGGSSGGGGGGGGGGGW
ncbi:MAG TPA: DUF2207 domain-containing protein [Allosphingosinicella sp.]|nr:DUF2207 domain-containing protein [Allosphingosinicella sp.]